MNMLCTQKREEEERQIGEEEVRRVEEKRARELYISLEQERKESEQDNKEWEEQCEYLFWLYPFIHVSFVFIRQTSHLPISSAVFLSS